MNTLKYTKPEVTLVDDATTSVRGIPKHGISPDMDGAFVTDAAYEVDE